MNFLDERITFTVNYGTGTLPENGMYKYTLYSQNISGIDPNVVFVGNFYYKGTRATTLDLSDVIRNTASSLIVSRRCLTTYTAPTFWNEDIYANYWLTIDFNGTEKTSDQLLVANVFRYPNRSIYNTTLNGADQFIDVRSSTYANTYTIPLQGLAPVSDDYWYDYFDMVPHYPLKNTDNFTFAYSFLFGGGIQEISLSIEDDLGAYIESKTLDNIDQYCIFSATYFAAISDFLSEYFTEHPEEGDEYPITTNISVILSDFVNEPVGAVFDICPKRYYLQWKDRFGSYQCQGFDTVSTYSEDIVNNELCTYDDRRQKYNIQVQPKWKINTGWLKDSLIPYYESIFVSPILILYDTKTDMRYEVVCNDNYIEKNYLNQKGLVNIEMNLECVEKQNIIY